MTANSIINKCIKQVGDIKLCELVAEIVKNGIITYRSEIEKAVVILNTEELETQIGIGKTDDKLYVVLVDGRFVLAFKLDENYNITSASIATPMVAAMLDLHVDVSSSPDAVTNIIYELAMRQLGLAPAP